MRKILLSIGLFVMSFLFSFTINFILFETGYVAAKDDTLKDFGGDSSYVFFNDSQVEEYIRSQFSGKADLTISRYGSDVKLNTKNFSQSYLNSYYKQLTGIDVDGSCSIVAIMSVIEYYDRVKNQIDIGTPEDAFVVIMKIAIENKWTDSHKKDGGTSDTKRDNIMTASFKYYGSKNEGNNDYFDLYDKIKSEVGSNRPSVFSIIGHSMVAAGYRRYKVQYTNTSGALWWKKTVTKTEYVDFVIVNDGWSNIRQYSYFPVDKISTNIIYRWDFNITKVIEKK